MTVEKEGVHRASSPVHLHVDEETPVHVHVKGKAVTTSVNKKATNKNSATEGNTFWVSLNPNVGF